MRPDSDYRAYLLRLWKTRDNGDCWRASLEDAHTRELHVFAELAGVFSYLDALTAGGLAAENETASPRSSVDADTQDQEDL